MGHRPRPARQSKADLSPEFLGRLAANIQDFETYVMAFWSLPDRHGRTRRFLLNWAQKIVLMEIERLAALGDRAILLKILKSRQLGISTLCCAYLQWRAQTHTGFKALSVADKLDLPRQWLRRAESWHRETPGPIQPRLAASNAIELWFEDIGSRLAISSAAGTTPGMGLTFQGFHGSELAFWRQYQQVMADLRPAIPEHHPGAVILLESTGDTEADPWYEEVQRTLRGEDGFTLVFLPWWLEQTYRVKPQAVGLDPGFEYSEEEQEMVVIAQEWATAHPEHAKLGEFKGLDRQQIAWYRSTCAQMFGGDLDLMRSRYPSQISDAFVGVGSLALSPAIIRQHRRTAREPIMRVQLEVWPDGDVQPVPFEGQGPTDLWPAHWAIFEEREEFCEYAIGGDVMEGELADPQEDRGDRDWSILGVLNRRNLRTTAEYVGQVETDVLARELIKAGRYWHWAWLAPEVNNAGWAVVALAKDYPYMMGRLGPVDEEIERTPSKLGWRTDATTRQLMLSDWVAHCRPEARTGFEGKIHCFSHRLAQEEGTFIKDKKGKWIHRAGCHDDAIFAYAIALQVHLRCPHDRRSPGPERVPAGPETRALGQPLPPEMAFAGGRDQGVERPADDWDWDEEGEDDGL